MWSKKSLAVKASAAEPSPVIPATTNNKALQEAGVARTSCEEVHEEGLKSSGESEEEKQEGDINVVRK